MKHVLLIEDDKGVREAITYGLEEAGYFVTALASGKKLLDGAFECPDIFIIDKQLSGVDGGDICKYLRSMRQYDLVPIIIISASPQAALLADCWPDVYFLEKPFPLVTLRDMVATHVRQGSST